jgi:hypothetical protein
LIETLGTLRYAEGAKKIKNVAVVNESAQDKMIRNLREENDKLKKILISAASDGGVINQEMLKDIQETFSGNQKAMEEMSIPFETRLI